MRRADISRNMCITESRFDQRSTLWCTSASLTEVNWQKEDV